MRFSPFKNTIFVMSWDIIVKVILLGIALSMDAFAVSITDGLIYSDLNKKKALSIAGTFGLLQALMPLVGYWLIESIVYFIDEANGEKVASIVSIVLTWIAFGLLVLIGGKMILESILTMNKEKIKKIKTYSYKEVFIMGIATSIDALATGFALRAGISTNSTIWLHVSIVLVITFIICLVGLVLAKQIHKLLKGRHEIANLIGGIILVSLAIWIVLSFYLI